VVLSKREKNVAIGVASGVAALIAYFYVVAPIAEANQKVAQDTQRESQQLENNRRLFSRELALKKVWNELIAGGLKSEESDASGQASSALREWMQDAGISIISFKGEKSTVEGSFRVTSFHASGSGPMRSIARLTWALETSQIPVRVNEMTITPRKEGTDDLQIQLSVSTLSMLPDAIDKPSERKTTLSRAEAGDR
jgi:hypothetical protein